MINTLYTELYCSSLLCVVSPYWQMVSKRPAQQTAPQCSLNSAEVRANAFSPWPLLFYLIIQNSVNLNLIAVCHGESHWACVREQLVAMHMAAGTLLFQVRDKVVAGDQLTWSEAQVYLLFVTAKSLDVTQRGRRKLLFLLLLWWIISKEAFRLLKWICWKLNYSLMVDY